MKTATTIVMLKRVHTVTDGEVPHNLSVAVKYMPFLLFSSRIEVQLGKHNLALTESTQQFISSAKVIRHSGYSSATLDNDIMLIKLAKPAQLNRAVQTVPLPTSCVATGTTCLISGWGNTLSNGSEYSVGMYSTMRARETLQDLTINSKQYRVKHREVLWDRPF